MLKRIVGLSLLCMAGHAYSANIVVNTTDDQDQVDDGKCSLREAITFVNNTSADGTVPKNGYGCSTDDGKASTTIVLEAGKTYSVKDKEIAIKKTLTINSLDSTASSIDQVSGQNNAIIKATGEVHRLFNIDDGNPSIANITVTISQVDFQGCGVNGTTACATSGGIIYNHENLVLSYSRLTHGIASSNGGAIYNEGIAVTNSSSSDSSAGLLTLTNTYYQNNQATQGAAIYSTQPRYEISSSVFRDNKATGTDGTIIYVERPANIDTTTSSSSVRTGNIRNSTIFNNTGRVANLLDGMIINNSTIIRNSAGIYLNSANGAANLSNSIVAENGKHDCIIDSSNKAITNNLLYSVGCGAGASDNPNINLSSVKYNQLLANTGIDGAIEGKCDKPELPGLLCPFQYQKEKFNGFFKPRLLTTYTKLSDSPIVNRGRVESGGTQTSTFACESTDQRGNTRETVVLCDIGSIELTISDPDKIGQDITFGQKAEIDLTDQLGDGALWPADQCDDVFKDMPNPPKVQNWQPGCLQYVDGKAPKKGSLLLNDEALLKYTPFSNYHGSDNFSLKLVTTTSRFSQGINDRTITFPGTIEQDPPNTFENKSVSTGSMGIAGLIGMAGLVWMRRRLQGVK